MARQYVRGNEKQAAFAVKGLSGKMVLSAQSRASFADARRRRKW
jgi:hypothetical protein